MLRIVGQSSRPDESAAYLRTAQPVRWGAGFFDEEVEEARAFRWMGLSAAFAFEPSDTPRHLEFSVSSRFHDLSQHLTVEAGAEPVGFELAPGWMQHSVNVAPGATRCRLTLDRPFPPTLYPTDSRTLGVQIREPLLHGDPVRHRHVARQHANARHNRLEMLDGKIRLESTPPVLGIDLYGVCNVKPPCVYCEWDWNKELEGENADAPFDLDTLVEYGSFFDNAHQLVNCSIGEPFMMKSFDDLLEAFGRQGKVLELTTNGQILTDRNIERLVGRSIDLYVSLDAGTAQTYAKLRNQRFDDILENLRRLNTAKGGRSGWPRVRLVFMPMDVNQHELEAFVEICAELEVDRMVLRPLNYSDSVDLSWDRSGYTFDYQRELLPFERLVELSAEAARLAAEHGVPLADQMDFGDGPRSFAESFDTYPAQAPPVAAVASPEHVASSEEPGERPRSSPESAEGAATDLGESGLPLCLEPWRSLYILRRGTMPCCYGGEPIADFGDYRAAWNSPAIVAIREALAAGRFPVYCLESPACPIVRKQLQAGELPWFQRVRLGLRRRWFAFERATDHGWRRAAAWPAKKAARFAVAFVRSPQEATANLARRLLGRPPLDDS